jgi:autotransporter adhesin
MSSTIRRRSHWPTLNSVALSAGLALLSPAAFAADSIAIGAGSQAPVDAAIAIGHDSQSTDADTIALGTLAEATADSSIAVGVSSSATGDFSMALGPASTASGEASVAIGTFSQATADSSVALGDHSMADRANTVSVGKAGAERQITNVAAGSEDTDAVNLAQLKQVGLVDGTGTTLDAVVYDAGSAKGQVTLGGGVAGTLLTNVRDGAIANGSRDAVNGGQIAALRDSLNGAITSIDNRVTSIEATGGGKGAPDFVAANGTPTPASAPANAGDTPGVALGYNTDASGAGASAIGDSAKAAGSDAVAIGNNASAAAENSVALGNNSVADRANAVSVGSAGHERQVTNVAAGVNAADAVNVQQLKTGNAQTLSSANAYTDSRFQGLSDEFSGLREDVGYRLGRLDDRIDRQGAMTSAMTNMAINAAHSRSPRGRIGVGAGWQNGESALSVGYSKEISDRASISIGGAFSSDDRSAGIGFGIDL